MQLRWISLAHVPILGRLLIALFGFTGTFGLLWGSINATQKPRPGVRIAAAGIAGFTLGSTFWGKNSPMPI
jgi:hypothetical protein